MLASLLLSLTAAAFAADDSLERDLGQLFMVAIDTEIAARYEPEIRSGRLGSAMLRWDKFTGEQARAFSEMMAVWTSSHTPFLVSTDHEGGTLFTQRLYGATIFPGNMALGAIGDPELAEQAAYAAGRELRALGIRFNFAPVIDVNSDPENPIVGVRAFGEDPKAVARLGAAALRGYARAGVAASAKHFPGHGDTRVDSHFGLPVSTKTAAELARLDLVPFAAAIKAGVPAVMPAHMVFPGLGEPKLPVTLSSAVIQGVLRGKLGFKGLVVSDSLDMGAIANTWGTPEAAVRSLEAGCDLLLIGKGDYKGAYAAVLAAVESGRIPRERVARSAAAVVALKRAHGLFSDPRPDVPLDILKRPENEALARTIAERSVTLLRADPSVLPLRKDARLVVVLSRSPSFANEARAFFSLLKDRAPAAQLVETGTRPTPAEQEAALAAAASADVVVLGDWIWWTLGAEQVELGSKLAALDKPLVHVAQLNPYGLARFPAAKSAVALYGASPYSYDAGAKLLFGELKPKGRLPVTIPGFAKRGSGLQAVPKPVKPGRRGRAKGQQR